MIRILIPTFLLVLSVSAEARFYSGNDLIVLIREHEKAIREQDGVNFYEAGKYQGYIIGTYDAFSLFMCPPKNVTVGQISAIVIDYFNKNPKQWHLPASSLVQSALFEAFPCPQDE